MLLTGPKDRRGSKKHNPSSKPGSRESYHNPSRAGLGSLHGSHSGARVYSEEPRRGRARAGPLCGLCKDLKQISAPVLSSWHPEEDRKPGLGKQLTFASSGRTEELGVCWLPTNVCERMCRKLIQTMKEC